jgi:hypothetical protein
MAIKAKELVQPQKRSIIQIIIIIGLLFGLNFMFINGSNWIEDATMLMIFNGVGLLIIIGIFYYVVMYLTVAYELIVDHENFTVKRKMAMFSMKEIGVYPLEELTEFGRYADNHQKYGITKRHIVINAGKGVDQWKAVFKDGTKYTTIIFSASQILAEEMKKSADL